MDGGAVFKFAVKVLADVARRGAGARRAWRADDIDWVIPHQANIRIMDATMKKLHLPHERLIVTVDQHGNTSAASIPLALDIAVRDGRISAGPARDAARRGRRIHVGLGVPADGRMK